jgi:hypothetical protein
MTSSPGRAIKAEYAIVSVVVYSTILKVTENVEFP